MKVWIDQDLCTGDGLCEEIAPDVFTLLDDGLAYVVENGKIFATAKGNPQGAVRGSRATDQPLCREHRISLSHDREGAEGRHQSRLIRGHPRSPQGGAHDPRG